MIIKRIKYSVVFIVMFFSCVNLAHANLEITEVMYDPQGTNTSHQWIEVYNNGSDSIDLSNWSVADYDTSWHFRVISSDSSTILSPNSWAIIAKTSDLADFKTKNPSLSGQLLKANITLNAGNGKIGLSSNKNDVISEVSYFSIMDNGNSLQLINGEWQSGVPTPGEENVPNTDSNPSVDIDNTSDTTTSTSSVSTSSTSSTSKEIPIIYKIATKIIAPKIVTASVPFSIDHSTTGISKEKVILGKFVWNFGDGMQKQLSISDPFSYVYEYPGEYVLSLSYADSPFDTKSDVVDRLTIKVIPSGVVISSVGTYADPFVEIENNSSYEMSLNKWILKGSVHSFVIPEGMVILPNKKLKLSPKITGFDFNDLNSISIIDQTGQTFATYPTKKTYSGNYYSTSNSQGNIVKADIVASDQVAGIANSPDVINLNDLGANAGSSGNGLNNKTLIYLGLAGIIIIGIVSVVLIRRKVDYPDYMEKEISAKDMTIIE